MAEKGPPKASEKLPPKLFSTEGIKPKAAFELIQSATDDICSPSPPINPKHGHVYVFKIEDKKPCHHWRSDKLSWENKRTKTWPRNLKEGEVPKMTISISKLLSFDPKSKKKEEVDFSKFEYYPHGVKMAYGGILDEKEWTYKYLVVEYDGTFDPEKAGCGPHGNTKATPEKSKSKKLNLLQKIYGIGKSGDNSSTSEATSNSKTFSPKNLFQGATAEVSFENSSPHEEDAPHSSHSSPEIVDIESEDVGGVDTMTTSEQGQRESGQKARGSHQIPHVRNSPIMIQELREDIRKTGKPAASYNTFVQSGFIAPSGSEEVNTPKNINQAYYESKKLRKLAAQDDLYELYNFTYSVDDFVRHLDLAEGLKVVLIYSGFVSNLNRMYETYDFIQFSYDTTFNRGTFFVSILTLRHPSFKLSRTDKMPAVPVAILLHQWTDTNAHRRLFSILKELVPGFDTERSICVSDREKSIRKAMKMEIPNARRYVCWNHLISNFSDWTKKHLKGDDNQLNYKKDLIKLMHTPCFEEYTEMKQNLYENWPEKLVSYHTENIDEAFLSSPRWILEKCSCYSPFSGLTSNASESINASLASYMNREKVTLTQFAHAFYFLSKANLVQIVNGYRGFGHFKFNSTDDSLRKSLQLSDTDVSNLHDAISEDKIEGLVFEAHYRDVTLHPSQFVDPRESKTMSGMAKLIIARQKLTFDPLNRCFHVRGMDRKRYTVELGNNMCSCGRKKECAHRLAVKWTCGLPAKNLKFEMNQVFNLGDLYKFHVDNKTGKKCGQLKRVKNPDSSTATKKSKINSKTAPSQKPGAAKDDAGNESENSQEESLVEAEVSDVSTSDEDVPLQDSNDAETTLSSSSGQNSDGYLSDHAASSSRIVSQNQSFSEPAPCEFPALPPWTEENESKELIHLNDFALTVNDLYSIKDGPMSRQSVIAYLKYICDDKADICIFYSEISKVQKEKKNWAAVKNVFILNEAETNFWAVAAVQCDVQSISVVTPLGKWKPEPREFFDLTSFIDMKNKRPEVDWPLVILEEHNCEDEADVDSGALALYFSSMLIQKKAIDADSKNLSPHLLILWDIVGNCSFENDMSQCHICESDQIPSSSTSVRTRLAAGVVTCKKCTRATHVACTKVQSHKINKPGFMHVCEKKEI